MVNKSNIAICLKVARRLLWFINIFILLHHTLRNYYCTCFTVGYKVNNSVRIDIS